MKAILVLTLLLIVTSNIKAKVLDKIVAVFNDEIISLSEVQRIQENMETRKNVALPIYNIPNTKAAILENEIRRKIIKKKLETIGFVITDEMVDSEIKTLMKRTNFTDDLLKQYLNSHNVLFSEYKEITRMNIENSIFFSRVIASLVSITDQQVKNEFFKQNVSNKALSFIYNLTDFYIAKDSVSSAQQLENAIADYRKTGNLSGRLANIETNKLSQITEDDLTKNIVNVLKSTDEGSVSKAVLIGDYYHVFFIDKKDITESNLYKENKERIRAKLFEKEAKKIEQVWFEREKANHYIRVYL